MKRKQARTAYEQQCEARAHQAADKVHSDPAEQVQREKQASQTGEGERLRASKERRPQRR